MPFGTQKFHIQAKIETQTAQKNKFDNQLIK